MFAVKTNRLKFSKDLVEFKETNNNAMISGDRFIYEKS